MSNETSPQAVQLSNAHEFDAVNCLLVTFVLGLSFAGKYWQRRLKILSWLPSAAIATLIGVVTGGLGYLLWGHEELVFLHFRANFFFFVLLPPIIFHAGFSMKKKSFWRNFGTICMFAVFGTLTSTFVIGSCTYCLACLNLIRVDSHSPLQSFLFGALISAVDPVATLSILGDRQTHCHPTLYSLVFGESVLNDAVAIVLFHAFLRFADQPAIFSGTSVAFYRVVYTFCEISLGSVAVGIITGLTCSFVCRRAQLQSIHGLELVVMALTIYAAFALGEALHLSGVMSLFFCGIMLAHYNWYNLSFGARLSTVWLFPTLASVSETFVFLYMGFSLFAGTDISWASFDPIFCIAAVLMCAFARMCSILPFCWIANCCHNFTHLCVREPITWQMQILLWFAGLRGAIAFALALMLPVPLKLHVEGSPGGAAEAAAMETRATIITTTLFVILFTTFVCGSLTAPLLDRLQLLDSAHGTATHKSQGAKEYGHFHRLWKQADAKYLRPLFGGPPSSGCDRWGSETSLFGMTPTTDYAAYPLQDAAGVARSTAPQEYGTFDGGGHVSVSEAEEAAL